VSLNLGATTPGRRSRSPEAVSGMASETCGAHSRRACDGQLRELPDESEHCCVTSPPYYGLRSYGTKPQIWAGDPNCQHEFGQARPNKPNQERENGQICQSRRHRGACATPACQRSAGAHSATVAHDVGTSASPTPELFIRHMLEVFREVRRVLRNNATCWVCPPHPGRVAATTKTALRCVRVADVNPTTQRTFQPSSWRG
jgi:hypothetical protein